MGHLQLIIAEREKAKHLAAPPGPMQASRLMRGYFGIGVEGISKPMNLGSLLRSAHAFGASFAFTIGAAFDARAAAQSDTSAAVASMPFFC